MTILKLKALTYVLDDQIILKGVDLHLTQGKILCILGPSGSGKTSLLRLIAGLEEVQTGEIWIDGRSVANSSYQMPPETRRVGLLFQEHALFPHLTVEANIAFGLIGRRKEIKKQIVEKNLDRVNLRGFEKRYPRNLSGGEQQRVALARALAIEPKILLLDEPFSSLDVLLKNRLREDTRALLHDSNTTTIFVSHDPNDAIALADQIAVLEGGHLTQYGGVGELVEKPVTRFAAELFSNFQTLCGNLSDDGVKTAFGTIPSHRMTLAGVSPSDRIELGVRPHSLRIRRAKTDMRIRDIRYQGLYYEVSIESKEEILRVLSSQKPAFDIGDLVEVDFAMADILLYN